jgi:dephospho-CoA kinase
MYTEKPFLANGFFVVTKKRKYCRNRTFKFRFCFNFFKTPYTRSYIMVLKIGLTGGIGSGKSTVAKIFEILNVPVYYADAASKRLYQTDAALIAALKNHFGTDIYIGAELNRAKLAQQVFNNPDKLALLNSLVHPPTIKDAEQWMQQQTAPYIIKEAALLFESGSVRALDYVIGVYAPVELRIKRVMERDGITREDVLARMSRQLDEAIKMKLCDFVIYNDEQQAVLLQVLQLHQRFLQQAAERSAQLA